MTEEINFDDALDVGPGTARAMTSWGLNQQ
jgi:hypothetical protein